MSAEPEKLISIVGAEILRLREENTKFKNEIAELNQQAKTLRAWLRNDNAKCERFRDLAEQLAELLRTHGHTPDNTPILSLLQKNQ